MRVLISGGGGFLGVWVTRWLLERGHGVRILDRRIDPGLVGRIVDDAGRVEWREGDIAEGEAVAEAMAGCDGVVHLAALLAPACHDDPVLGARVNLIGTLNVFEAARRHGLRRVAYASSAGVFGPDDGVIPRPTTHYGAFKLACEGCARAYHRSDGISSIGFRPLVIYGPGRERGLSAGPTLACRAAALGHAYVVPFTGSADFIYVEDVAAALGSAAVGDYAGAHAVNLSGEVATVEAFIDGIRRHEPGADLASRGEPLPIHAALGPGDTASLLGDLPRTSLSAGIARTLEHYRRAAAR